VFKTTPLKDGMREARILSKKLNNLSFVPKILSFHSRKDKAVLEMTWHSGQHPRAFDTHTELRKFLRILLAVSPPCSFFFLFVVDNIM